MPMASCLSPDSGATRQHHWMGKFSQDSLQAILAATRLRRRSHSIEPMIEQPADAKAKQREQRIDDMNQHIKEPPKATRPTQNIGFRALFSTPHWIVPVLRAVLRDDFCRV